MNLLFLILLIFTWISNVSSSFRLLASFKQSKHLRRVYVDNLKASSVDTANTADSADSANSLLCPLDSLPRDAIVEILSFALDDFSALLQLNKYWRTEFMKAFKLLSQGSIPRDLITCPQSTLLLLCRDVFSLDRPLKLLPSTNQAESADFQRFLKSAVWWNIFRRSRNLFAPETLLVIWSQHGARALRVIEACLRTGCIEQVALFKFPGIIKHGFFSSAAANCPAVLSALLTEIEKFSQDHGRFPVPWRMLDSMLKSAISAGAQDTASLLIQRFDAYHRTGLQERLPDPIFGHWMLLLSLQRNLPAIAEEILFSSLMPAGHSELSSLIVKESVRSGTVRTFERLLQMMRQGHFGLAAEAVRWNRVDLLESLKGQGLLEEGLRGGTEGDSILNCAVKCGAQEALQFLLRELSGEWLGMMDASGWLPVHWAAHRGDVRSLELLLAHGDRSRLGAWPMVVIEERSPLRLAVAEGHVAIVRALVERFPRWLELDDCFLIEAVLVRQSQELLDYLLRVLSPSALKRNLTSKNADGRTALLLAVQLGKQKEVEMLEAAAFAGSCTISLPNFAWKRQKKSYLHELFIIPIA